MFFDITSNFLEKNIYANLLTRCDDACVITPYLFIYKARSKLGLLIRTCHFTTNKRQKRAFYLAVIRSMFEHCSIIWYSYECTQLSKFDSIQRRTIEWINGEQFTSYGDNMLFEKQKELNILPIRLKFVHNTLTVFYKIVNKLVDVSMPKYIHKVHPQALRFTKTNANTIHCRDTSSYFCTILPNYNAFRNSFFYRTMVLWNFLPIDIRNIDKISSFKRELTKYMWTAGNSWPD